MILIEILRGRRSNEKNVAARCSFLLHCTQRMVVHALASQHLNCPVVSSSGGLAPSRRRKWKHGIQGTLLSYDHCRDTLRQLPAHLVALNPDCLLAAPQRSRSSATGRGGGFVAANGRQEHGPKVFLTLILTQVRIITSI